MNRNTMITSVNYDSEVSQSPLAMREVITHPSTVMIEHKGKLQKPSKTPQKKRGVTLMHNYPTPKNLKLKNLPSPSQVHSTKYFQNIENNDLSIRSLTKMSDGMGSKNTFKKGKRFSI